MPWRLVLLATLAGVTALLLWPRNHQPDVSAFTILSVLAQSAHDPEILEAALGSLYDKVEAQTFADAGPNAVLRQTFRLGRGPRDIAHLDCASTRNPREIASMPGPHGFEALVRAPLTAETRTICSFSYTDAGIVDLGGLGRLWPFERPRDHRARAFGLQAEIWAEHSVGPLADLRDADTIVARQAISDDTELRAISITPWWRDKEGTAHSSLTILQDLN